MEVRETKEYIAPIRTCAFPVFSLFNRPPHFPLVMQRDFLAVRQGPQPRFVYVCVQHTDLLLWSLRLEEIFEPRRGLEGEGKREKGVGRIAADGQISFEKPFVPCVRTTSYVDPLRILAPSPPFPSV